MLSEVFWTCVLVLQGVFCLGSDVMSVKEGESVTLHNDFNITKQDKIRWYFNDTQIAGIDLYNGETCTDVQCNEGTEGFRGRLKLDHQTGSLAIMNIRKADSGNYTQEVFRTGGNSEKTFIVIVLNVTFNPENPEGLTDTSDPGVLSVFVPVIEDDSVTLYNNLKITNEDKIRWYFKNIQIAEIDLYNGKICTDVQCNEGAERFRDRLELDHQTGNLTIMNIRNTDSGEYILEIINPGGDHEKKFIVKVYGAGSVIKSVKKGDSVTLENDFKRPNQHMIRWYFKYTQIAEIDLYNGKNCTDVQCNEGTERFRDRLKLDHQTGNLTIMNITNTDSGEYILDVIYPGGDIEKIFIVIVLKATDDHKNPEGQSETSGPGVPGGAVAGICVAVLLVIGAAAAIYHRRRIFERFGCINPPPPSLQMAVTNQADGQVN